MPDNLYKFLNFIRARHEVHLARQAGKPWPWSENPILQKYKFCNAYRELDRVTREIAALWRDPYQHDKHLWFAMVVARRCLNSPSTLRKLGYPVPWDANHFLLVLERRKQRGKQVFNSEPYKLLLSGQAGDLPELQVQLLLSPMWTERERLRPHSKDTLQSFHARLASSRFMGGFYAGQVVADLKYVGNLRHAKDWWDFAASGPGSRRGLNRVLDRPTNNSWRETEWLDHLQRLRKTADKVIDRIGFSRMHAQDVQNCLCEFDKFERIRLGEGRGRKFIPNPKPLPGPRE